MKQNYLSMFNGLLKPNLKLVSDKILVFVKFSFVLFFVLGGFMKSHAQDSIVQQKKFTISLSSGLNHNSITYNASNRVNTEYVGQRGNYYKLGFNYLVYKNMSIQTGITYLNKNYKYQRTGGYSGIFTEYETQYFNLPVMFGFKPLDFVLKNTKFDLDIFVGGYVGYWHKLTRSGVTPSLAEIDEKQNSTMYTFENLSYDFKKNENNFNRFDAGCQIEGKISYNAYKAFDVFLEYSLMYGLTDNQKNEVRKISRYYYTTSNFGIGLSYKF